MKRAVCVILSPTTIPRYQQKKPVNSIITNHTRYRYGRPTDSGAIVAGLSGSSRIPEFLSCPPFFRLYPFRRIISGAGMAFEMHSWVNIGIRAKGGLDGFCGRE